MEHFLRFPPYVCVSVMETFRGRPLMLGENVAVILCFWGGGVLKIPWKSSSFWSLRLLNHPDRLLLVMQFFENRTDMNFLQINYTIRRLSSCLRAFYQSHRSAVILLTVTLFSRLLFWFPSNVTHVGLSLISPSSDSSSWYHHHQNCKLTELCLLLMRSLRGVFLESYYFASIITSETALFSSN